MLIRRREFITALGAGLSAEGLSAEGLGGGGLGAVLGAVLGGGPLAREARAQAAGQVRRLGVLIFSAEDDPVNRARLAALRDELDQTGWTEGRNLEIAVRYGGAEPGRLHASAVELANLAPDVILTGAAPATRAMQQVTQTIPIVFVEVTNEVGYGLTGKLAREGANATGITNLYLAIGARWLELLRQAAPGVGRVALIHNPDFDSRGYLAAIEAAAAADRVMAVRMPVRTAQDIKHAIDAFAPAPGGGLIVVPPTPAFSNIEVIFHLATQYRLPAIYPVRGLAAEGGLMAFGAVSTALYRDAARYVDRILRGAKPADLPVLFPTRFELVVNLKAARAIGLEFPHTILARAAEVIE